MHQPTDPKLKIGRVLGQANRNTTFLQPGQIAPSKNEMDILRETINILQEENAQLKKIMHAPCVAESNRPIFDFEKDPMRRSIVQYKLNEDLLNKKMRDLNDELYRERLTNQLNEPKVRRLIETINILQGKLSSANASNARMQKENAELTRMYAERNCLPITDNSSVTDKQCCVIM